jgi:hypothetical protein
MWRRRPAGGFCGFRALQKTPARRRRHKNRALLAALYFRKGNGAVSCLPYELFFRGFGNSGACTFQMAATKEKRQMPGAALAAAERPHQQKKHDGPLDEPAPVRTQNVPAAAERALPRTDPEGNRVRPGHKLKYIVRR